MSISRYQEIVEVKHCDSLRSLTEFISDLMSEASNDAQAAVNAIRMIESSGCAVDVIWNYSDRDFKPETRVKVISFDLVWLSPGPLGSWSDEGKQFCYCISNPDATRSNGDSWYSSVLSSFFSGENPRSLLSFSDIYKRRIFFEVQPLYDSDRETVETEGLLHSSPSTHVWKTSFTPNPKGYQPDAKFDARFTEFRQLLQTELSGEFGSRAYQDSYLVWIYVSAGANPQAERPPLWASSMFILLRFEDDGKRARSEVDRDRDRLLSNLSRCLQDAAQATLQSERLKSKYGQALAHEFKNMNQDIAVISEQVLTSFMDLRPTQRSKLKQLHEKLQMLQWVARSTAALSSAAYWIARPDKTMEYFPDPCCHIFRHTVSVAIHLVSLTRRNWKLIDIPPIDECVALLSRHFGISDVRHPADLLKDKNFSLLWYFALEPVRNVRARNTTGTDTPIYISIRVKRNVLTLHQKTNELAPDSEPIRSETVASLMQLVRDNFNNDPFIEVDPVIASTVGPTGSSKSFLVERVTRFVVNAIPSQRVS